MADTKISWARDILTTHLLAVLAGVPGDGGGVALGQGGDILDDAAVAGGLRLLRHQHDQEADQEDDHCFWVTYRSYDL